MPQVAVTFILLYVPEARFFQFGAPDQAISVAVIPLLQVKAGGVIPKPEGMRMPAGTEPQVSVAGLTVNEPGQLAFRPLDVPQVAVTLILLYVPETGLLQFGAFSHNVKFAGIPLLQVKVGCVISTSEIPLVGTEPQVSVTSLTTNVPQETFGEIPCPQSATANTS